MNAVPAPGRLADNVGDADELDRGIRMDGPTGETDLARPYVLGHSKQELDRLMAQARLIDPITGRFLRDAGVVPGMRVLDVGTGAGDVAFLAAGIVGAAGEVVGVDRVSAALDSARARALAQTLDNVSFREGDPTEMSFEEPFDAIIGRYVLQFQSDPSAMLRKLVAHLRPGGPCRLPRDRLGRH